MRTVFGSTLRSTLCALAVFYTSFVLVNAATTGVAHANSKYAGIVVDAKTGKTLYANNADAQRYPASLTKMMTLYLLFEAIENGDIKKSTRIRVSKHAASMQPSKLGIKAGGSLTAEQAIYALVTKSANDVAVAIAEHLGGSEQKFASDMNEKARSLGMKQTTFKNASGLPDSQQVTTARDMARLGIALREHFPDEYKYFQVRYFKYGSHSYGNHNRLLGKVRGVDGIKTGYTRASGYNLVSSVEDKNRSIVAVVLGGRSGNSRNAQMTTLIGKYLRKGSTGKDRVVVAKDSPKRAYAGVADGKSGTAQDAIAVQTQLAELSAKQIPVPVQSPITLQDPVVTAAVRPAVGIAKVEKENSQAAETSGGWQIQIGAVPTKQSALDRLNIARSMAPKTLGNVSTHTMSVNKNGVTLYRARFAGFSSKQEAWDACAELKKKFDCLALAN